MIITLTINQWIAQLQRALGNPDIELSPTIRNLFLNILGDLEDAVNDHPHFGNVAIPMDFTPIVNSTPAPPAPTPAPSPPPPPAPPSSSPNCPRSRSGREPRIQ